MKSGLKPVKVKLQERLTYGDKIEAVDCGGLMDVVPEGTVGYVFGIYKEGMQYEIQWETKTVSLIYRPRDKYIKLCAE